MKTLIIGDSFVHDIVTTYADIAKKEYKKVIPFGLPGAGNDLIANTILLKYKEFDNIIINWTSSCRYDILINDKSIIKLLYKNSTHHIIENQFFLCSGGWRGNWIATRSKNIFESMYRNHFNVEDSWRRTLQNIIMVQQILESENINHISFFSYDTFICQSFTDYEKKFQATKLYDKNKWQKFLQKNKWTHVVDWSKVWMHKNQYTDTGGIMDWCHDNTTDTSHHPTTAGHEQFYQSIIKPWLEQHN